MRTIEDAKIQGKRVLIRVDLNVPFSSGSTPPEISDDYRLRVIMPTLQYLRERDAKIIIMAHLGQPKDADPSLSLKPVYQHLAALLRSPIKFAPNLFSDATKKAVEELEPGEILGLENLRFDKGEQINSRTFARKLAEYGDIYIDDAFSVAHREAASLCAITEFLPSYGGLLMETEVRVLGSLLRHPANPFVAIIGGAKIGDKLPLIKYLVHQTDHILIGGGIANTFIAAQGQDVKGSLIEKEAFDSALGILKQAGHKIVLPEDYAWQEDKILDIGPKTVELFKGYLKNSKTIFWNGCLGYTEDPKFAKGSDEIAKYIAEHGSTSIIGGGNTVEIITRLNLINKMTFVSSGGGATLEFLSGQSLPGIKALD